MEKYLTKSEILQELHGIKSYMEEKDAFHGYGQMIGLLKRLEKETSEGNKQSTSENSLDIQAVTCRNSVRWFVMKMEAKLVKNDHKGGWGNCDLQYLSMRLTQERKELTGAIKSKDKQRIIDECADIANFAMMIADRFGENYGR